MKHDRSPKWGVNPSEILCFWCGNHLGIALSGRIDFADTKAPSRCFVTYNPCLDCQERWKNKVVITEATKDNPFDVLEIVEGKQIYPTGEIILLDTDKAERVLGREVAKEERVILDSEIFQAIKEQV